MTGYIYIYIYIDFIAFYVSFWTYCILSIKQQISIDPFLSNALHISMNDTQVSLHSQNIFLMTELKVKL